MIRARLDTLKSHSFRHRAYNGLARRLARLQHDTARVDDVEMPYLHAGTGRPLVLLHGFADSKETWLTLAPWLARKRRVLAPDLPGYGEASPIEPHQAHLGQQADYLARWLDRMELDQVDLCGNSMGGGVALTFAARHPDRVRALALLSSMGPEVAVSELRQRCDAGANPLLPSSHEEYEVMLDFIFSRRPPLPTTVRKLLATRHIERRERYRLQFDALLDTMTDDLEALDRPTLVIHGRHDRLIHPATGETLARRLPRARLVMLEGVGHAPQWEATRRTYLEVESLLDRLDHVDGSSKTNNNPL